MIGLGFGCLPDMFSYLQIIKKFRCRIDPRYEEMVSRPGAGNIEQVTLGVVDLFQIGVVGHRLDPCLQWNDFVIAGHHNHGSELQALGKMHGADGNMAAGGFNLLVEYLEREAGMLDRSTCPVQFRLGTDENTHFVWYHPFLPALLKPCTDSITLLFGAVQNANDRIRSIEDRDGALPFLCIAVHIGQFGTQ